MTKNYPYENPVKIGRNDFCVCGSGKKYKKCCYGIVDETTRVTRKFLNILIRKRGDEYEGKRIARNA
jgi:hypothetical protein